MGTPFPLLTRRGAQHSVRAALNSDRPLPWQVFKIAPISDHVAKLRGDRPRDRGDLALKKKKKERNK